MRKTKKKPFPSHNVSGTIKTNPRLKSKWQSSLKRIICAYFDVFVLSFRFFFFSFSEKDNFSQLNNVNYLLPNLAKSPAFFAWKPNEYVMIDFIDDKILFFWSIFPFDFLLRSCIFIEVHTDIKYFVNFNVESYAAKEFADQREKEWANERPKQPFPTKFHWMNWKARQQLPKIGLFNAVFLHAFSYLSFRWWEIPLTIVNLLCRSFFD